MKKKELREVKERLLRKATAFAQMVAPIYVLLQWGWGVDAEIPNAEKIEKMLITELIEKATVDTRNSSTGGLGIIIEPESDGSISASLYFEIEEGCL